MKIRSIAFNSGFAIPGVYPHKLSCSLFSLINLPFFLHLIGAKLCRQADILSQFMIRLESQSLKAPKGGF